MKRDGKNDKPDIKLVENSKISLDICILDVQGNESTLSLSAFVEKVNADNSFLIQVPKYQNSYYPLARNEPYLMYFTAELERNMTPKIFEVPVCFIEEIERGGLTYARMEPVGDIVQSQRRDCYRLPISLSVSLQRTSQTHNQNELPASAKMIDFSDGGMLFSTYENLSVDETLILDFIIGGHETVEGVVLRTESPKYKKREFNVAVKFTNAQKAQKQRFYQFIVEKQLEKRRCKMWAS